MASAMNGGNPLILAALLIGGAMLYSRSMTARAQPARSTTKTMPGSAGSGTQQIVGGILGTLGNWIASKPASTSKTWSVWEPFDGVSHDPQKTSDFVAVQDIFNAGIENEPVYKVEMASDIIRDAAGTNVFEARPGAYSS